jgi:oligopeptide transport system substrate-binding protein
MPKLLALLFFFFQAIAFANDTKTFRVRLPEDLGTLDWNYGEVNPEVVYQLMEGLFRANGKGQPVNAAVRSYKWNEDKTEMVVRLEPDRRWSDGSPLCAQQFVDSWARLQSKSFASPYAHYAHVLKSYEARSCRELVIRFERSAPEAPALLSHYVFFPIRLDNLKKQPKIFNRGAGLLVNGPFRPVEWKVNEKLVLERNPQFARKPGTIDRLEFFFVPDESTAKTMFEQKHIDWMKDIPQILRTPALERSAEFRVFPSLIVYYFGVNGRKSALAADPVVRRALSDALDRREIAKVLGRENRGVRSWLPPELVPGEKLTAPPVRGFGTARAILAKAVKSGKMDLALRVYAKSAHRLLAEWAQGQWEKKLGVRIPVEVHDGKAYWKEIVINPSPIFLSGVTAPFGHPRAFQQEFLGTSTANWTGWSSDAYDQAVKEGRFLDAEKILAEEGFVIPLYARDTAVLVQKRWRNFEINPLGQVFLTEVQ